MAFHDNISRKTKDKNKVDKYSIANIIIVRAILHEQYCILLKFILNSIPK